MLGQQKPSPAEAPSPQAAVLTTAGTRPRISVDVIVNLPLITLNARRLMAGVRRPIGEERRMRYLSGAGVACLWVVLLSLMCAAPVAGQVKNRLVPFPGWAASLGEDEEVPPELVEIKVAGRAVVLGQPFAADGD